MQIDMHYYGTYALARAAGLRADTCQIIASAAQFVDDNAKKQEIHFKDKGRIDLEATAHHALDIHNIEPEDQRNVWVPFHFLPGAEGESYEEKLVCRKDSKLAREMRDHHLGFAEKPYACELLGVAAHVYADTFSHYGFSGISSDSNRIINDSFIFPDDLDPDIRDHLKRRHEEFLQQYEREGGSLRLYENAKKKMSWFTKAKSWLAENASGALGHGPVATYPDRPYLHWSFEYELPVPTREHRPNPETFLEGCEALFRMFEAFGERRTDLVENGVKRGWGKIADPVKRVLERQGKKADRIAYWQEALRQGALTRQAGESILPYQGKDWLAEIERLDGSKDSSKVLNRPVFRFFQAAAQHRTYVIRELMPSHDLIID